MGGEESVTGTQFAVVWAIQALVCCAVDVYAIISGYVGYDDGDKSYRYWKIIVLWLQVFIYSVLITVVIQCISGEVSVKEIVKACIPVTTTQYWYFSAYVGVFFAAPFVNKVVRNLSEKKAGIAFVFFSIFVGYISVTGVFYDPFIVYGGYSFLWLLIMYIMGAFIKKCRLIDKCCGWRATLIVILCFLLSLGGKMCLPSQNIFISYMSCTTILESLMLVILFANIRIKSDGLQCKIIEYLAPTSFGVYLIHDNPALRNFLIKNKFEWVAGLPAYEIPFVVVAIAAVIFICSSIIDIIRIKMFSLIRINALVQEGLDKFEKQCRAFVERKW